MPRACRCTPSTSPEVRIGGVMKLLSTCLLALLSVTFAFSQVTTTSRLDGTVSDTQGAAVPAAQVQVVLGATDQMFKVTTDEKGYWVIPGLQSGIYRVTVARQGFKTATTANVKIDAGVPATVNLTLEVGALT